MVNQIKFNEISGLSSLKCLNINHHTGPENKGSDEKVEFHYTWKIPFFIFRFI